MPCKQIETDAQRLREAATALRLGGSLPAELPDLLDRASLALERGQAQAGEAKAWVSGAQQRLAAIVQSSQDAIVTWDMDGRITSWNAGARQMYGYAEKEVLGCSATLLLPAERDEEAMWILSRIRGGRAIHPFETIRVGKQRRPVDVFVSVSPMRDPQGRVTGISVIERDITEQISAEQAILEGEERLELAMWGSQLGVWDRDVATGRLVFNEQWANMLGYGRDEIEPHARAWRRLIHPDDLARVNAAMQAHLSGESPAYEVEHRLRAKSGEWRWVLSRGRVTAWNPEGSPIRVTGTHQDITERKQVEQELRESEQRFRELAAHTHEVFWMADVDHSRVIYVSPAYERVWGRGIESLYESAALWLKTVHEDDRQAVLKVLTQQAREQRVSHKFRIRRPDGALRWIMNRATPIRDDCGRVYRIVGVAEDVTEQHLAKTEAHQKQEQAAHMARLNMLGEMATGFAHELNQPLAAICNYAQGCLRWLEGGRFDAAQFDEAMRRVLAQSERAGMVIQRIRRLARKHEPEQRSLDLNVLLREATALAEHDALHHDVEIRLALHDGEMMILGDGVQLEQVILNLLRNAIEAIDGDQASERRIDIRTQVLDGDQVRLLVRDDGPGMTDKQMDHMFHPFFTSKEGGMGMGLNICQSIVESHGGRLEGYRNENRGMSFVMTLPADTQRIG